MMSIPMLLFYAPVSGIDIVNAGTWLIYIAAALTLWSMGYYMHAHGLAGDRQARRISDSLRSA